MNLSASECSSGCESGWTVYFDEASNSNSNRYTWANCDEGKERYAMNEDHQEEDCEDLSMVSDASSGPPHFQEYQNYGFESQRHYCGYNNDYSVSQGERKNKKKSSAKEKQQQNLCLDDTASSPFFHFTKDNVPKDNHDSAENVYGFSQVCPAAHFEDESLSKKHLGFFKSSKKGKSGSFLGRKRQ